MFQNKDAGYNNNNQHMREQEMFSRFKMDQSEDAGFSHTKVRSDPVNNCSPFLSLLVRWNLRKNDQLMKVKKGEHTQAYKPIDQVKE